MVVGILVGAAIGYQIASAIIPKPVVTTTVTVTATPAPVKEVRLGYLVGLTGAIASFGPDMKAMAELVVDEVNAAGGIKSLGGAKIRLIVADTESKPDVAKVQTRRLVTEEKVHVLAGAFWSSLTFPASEEAESLGIPFVCDTSSNPDLIERGYRTFFRVWPGDDMLAKQQLEFLKWMQQETGTKVRRIALVHDDTAFGIGCAKFWKRWNSDPDIGGYEIVSDIAFTPGVADVSAEVLALKGANPEVVFYASSPAGDAILWMTSFKKYDVNLKAIISSGGFMLPDYVKAMGKDGWYATARDFWSPDLLDISSKIKGLNEKFKAKTGGKDLYLHPLSVHPTIQTIVKALEKAGSTEPSKIIDALRAVEIGTDELVAPWKGIRFDHKGQNVYAINFMVQLMEDAQYHIVWPKETASRKVKFPMPTWAERR